MEGFEKSFITETKKEKADPKPPRVDYGYAGRYDSGVGRDIIKNTEKTDEEKVEELLSRLQKAEEELNEWYEKEERIKDEVVSLKIELTKLEIDPITGKSMYGESAEEKE